MDTANPQQNTGSKLGGDVAVLNEGIGFFSAAYRMFKLEALEPQCEDYWEAVSYRGILPGAAGTFRLDNHHSMEAGRIFPVCGNTWRMLAETLFAP